jgi:peptide/nickel transport system substrate-binding protein
MKPHAGGALRWEAAMDKDAQRRLDAIRAGRSELENAGIDELVAGRVSRRDFLRWGTVIGISLPTLAVILEACGGTNPTTTGGNIKKGGRLNVGHQTPTGAMDPILTNDLGRLTILGQCGEYLSFSDKDLKLRPVLATSWSPNTDGSVWTFKIRQGVKYNDGTTPMTVDDVVATFNRLADPNLKGNNALSNFAGVLSKGNVTKVDDQTVKFQLDAPNGNFPYLVSSDNYNAIILPANYSGNWDQTFIGTGPFKLKKYTVNDSVSLDKNPTYWDPNNQPYLDGLDFKFYDKEPAAILAFQAGSLDVYTQFSVSNGQGLLTDPNTTVIDIPTTAHRQIHMRNDQAPFSDKRLRQALALSIDRSAMVQGLWNGKAQIANDHPIFKVYPSSDSSVPQRTQDVTKAKDLMSQAGKSSGLPVTLYTEQVQEIPALAQLLQAAGKAIGINITLNITDSGTYYDKYWLDSPLGITDYGHRGVPNTFLQAPLLSTGTWNAAHFANATYDGLFKDYVKAIDLAAQKAVTGKIETLLLDETPLIIPYNYDFLTAVKKKVAGVETTGMGHVNFRLAGITS